MELRWRAFRIVPWVWTSWERFYLLLFPISPVGDGSLFAVTRRGSTLELHLDSKALARMRREEGYSTFKALHQMRSDLAVLAERMRSGEFAGVTELRGKSLMGEAGAVLGFQTRVAPPTVSNAFLLYFQVGLDAAYHPRGLRERAKRRWPVEISMSIAGLLESYPPKSDRSTVAR